MLYLSADLKVKKRGIIDKSRLPAIFIEGSTDIFMSPCEDWLVADSEGYWVLTLSRLHSCQLRHRQVSI